MASGKRHKNKLYAVAKGRKCGIYKTWRECESQTKGYKGAIFKSFSTLEEAKCFVNSQSSSFPTTPKDTKATNANTTSVTRRQVVDQPKKQNTTKVGLKLADERSVCYAVARGQTPGLYRTWDECKRQTTGFSSPVFKKFSNGTEAVAFMALQNDDWYLDEQGEEIRTNEITTNTKAVQENNNLCAEQQQYRPTKTLWIQLWFDGGSRGNPGISGSGAHLIISTLTSVPKSQALRDANNNNPSTKDDDNYGKVESSKKTKVVNVRHYCGEKYTNNYAEYCGLREGLLEAKHHVDEFCNNIGSNLQNIGFRSSPRIPFNAADFDFKGGNDTCEDWFYQIKLDIKGDSNLIIEQLNGNYACRKETLVKIYQDCKEMICEIQQKTKMKITNTAAVERNRNLVPNTPTTIESGHNRISVVVNHMHVYRDKNAVADALANEAMDQRRSWKTFDGCSESDDNIC